MTEITLKNAERMNVYESKFVPPWETVAVMLKIDITPPSGAVLVYSPAKDDPVRFDGPSHTARVPLLGPFIYVQKIGGCTDCAIVSVGPNGTG
jgi:hypothetical protein